MREFLLLMVRNTVRHRLRVFLTVGGIVIALASFAFIRMLIDAWYSGVEASSKNRLITRNAVSLVFYLPRSYFESLRTVPGVLAAGWGNWFGGKYEADDKFRFQQFAISDSYLDVYPEYKLGKEERRAFDADRTGTLIGRELAERFNLHVGDTMQLSGTIFPGLWQFTVRGIFHAEQSDKDTRIMFFHWDYLNERNKAELQRNPDNVGFYALLLKTGINEAAVSQQIDALFANSSAETVTETETAFVQGFVSMSSTIISALNIISLIVSVIMLLVMTNTMLMSTRERYREYAIMKALGFPNRYLYRLICGEALVLCLAGFVVLMVLLAGFTTLPGGGIPSDLKNFFPRFSIRPLTVVGAFAISLIVALVAGSIPAVHIARMRVTEALRKLG